MFFYGGMHWGVTPIDHFINKMMHPSKEGSIILLG